MSDDRLPASVLLLLDERARQVVEKGYDSEHDQHHTDEQLAQAAAVYATPEQLRRPGIDVIVGGRMTAVPYDWPWSAEDWKPGDRVDELVKAGALIIAELDRIILEEAKADA